MLIHYCIGSLSIVCVCAVKCYVLSVSLCDFEEIFSFFMLKVVRSGKLFIYRFLNIYEFFIRFLCGNFQFLLCCVFKYALQERMKTKTIYIYVWFTCFITIRDDVLFSWKIVWNNFLLFYSFSFEHVLYFGIYFVFIQNIEL